MITEADYEAYLDSLRERYPDFRVIAKAKSPLNQAIDKVLRLLTFGGQSTYLSHYVTTLGARIYTPEDWERRPPKVRYSIMRHEAVHIAQFKRYGWLGMSLLYTLLPLPFGFAAGRAWLEWQAYRETIIATWQIDGSDAARSQVLREEIIKRFTGPDYGWMWLRAKTIEGALDRLLKALEADPPETLKRPHP